MREDVSILFADVLPVDVSSLVVALVQMLDSGRSIDAVISPVTEIG